MSKRERELKKLVERCGYRVAVMEQRKSGHIRITMQDAHGEQRSINTSLTPSDRKGDLNLKTQIKRVWA